MEHGLARIARELLHLLGEEVARPTPLRTSR